MSDLKKKAINGAIWSSLNRFGGLGISFITNIILARLLTPDDFGNLGVLFVFIALSQAFIDGGFASALIQRRDAQEKDYSTVFFWNIILATFFVALLFFSAPLVAKFYKNEILCPVLRLESMVLIISSLSIIQITRLTKSLNFKTTAIATLAGAFAGSISGIYLAFLGYGVWSLVWKEIIAASVSCLILWLSCRWYPSLEFSFSCIRKMFSFGSSLMVSSIINVLYVNIQSLIIGRVFSLKELGYYTQAKKMEELPSNGITGVLSSVLFPVYSAVNDDWNYLKVIVRKNLQLVSFLTMPLMTFLCIAAKPIFIILFSEKWIEAVPMFQILCVGGLFYSVNCANTEIFKAIGRGDVYFILQTVKRVVSIILIIAAIPFGLYPMIWVMSGTGILFYIFNIVFTHKCFNYSLKEQLEDILPNLLLGLSTGGIVWISWNIIKIEEPFLLLLLYLFSYGALFYIGIVLTKNKGLYILYSVTPNKLKPFLSFLIKD